MSFGERAALEGVLAQLRPRLALEIGSAEGGSLARIAAYACEVHSVDVSLRSLPGRWARTFISTPARARGFFGVGGLRLRRAAARSHSSTATTRSMA